jgi:fructose-1,6-bisphosphatase/inositol monophosphatase family enzyme
VARNEVAGFIQYESTLKSWDHAAGLLCVSESGGTATDGAGGAVRFYDREVAIKGAVVCCAAASSEKTRQLFRIAAKPA